jgi:hypothetical protein
VNAPTKIALDRLLAVAGADSTQLGSASVGLITGTFTPGPTLTIADIVEANFTGYTRKSIGNPTVPFTGADGLEYVEGNTLTWMPSDTVTPNTITGLFVTPGNDSTKLFFSDKLASTVPLPGPGYQLTVTPRFGLNPTNGFGMNVVSN